MPTSATAGSYCSEYKREWVNNTFISFLTLESKSIPAALKPNEWLYIVGSSIKQSNDNRRNLVEMAGKTAGGSSNNAGMYKQ